MKKFMIVAMALAMTCGAVYAVNPDPAAQEQAKRRKMAGVHRLFRLALVSARAREDTQLQALVDKAIADRKAMITAESARITAVENLIAAVRSQDQEQIQAKRDALKVASDALRAATELVVDDIMAIRDRLHELHPELLPQNRKGREGRGKIGPPPVE